VRIDRNDKHFQLCKLTSGSSIREMAHANGSIGQTRRLANSQFIRLQRRDKCAFDVANNRDDKEAKSFSARRRVSPA